MTPSAHLLRTLAAVAPGTRVVDLACGDGRHLVPLARLGFDVLGVTDPPGPAAARLAEVLDDARQRVVARSDSIEDASADWVVLAVGGAPDRNLLGEARRILRPGGWVWVEVDHEHDQAMAAGARDVGLAEAEEPGIEGERVHAVYRNPGAVA